MDASRDSAAPAKSCIGSPGPRELLPNLDVQLTTRQPGPKPLPVRPDAPHAVLLSTTAPALRLQSSFRTLLTGDEEIDPRALVELADPIQQLRLGQQPLVVV